MSELTVGSLSGLAANSYVIDVASGSSLDLSNGATLPAGSVLQVVSTAKTDTFSTSSSSYVDVTGMSATITPSSTSSKILILVQATIGWSDGTAPFGHWRISGGNATDYVGDAAGSRVSGVFGGIINSGTETRALNTTLSINYLDSPSTTSAVTYQLQTRLGAVSGTYYLNRSTSDPDDTNGNRGASSITLMEVAG